MDRVALRVASRHFGLDPLSYAVARRFQADAIANPQELLQKYDHVVSLIADQEHLLPKLHEAQKVMDAHPGEDVAWKAHRNLYPPHENDLITLYQKNIYRIGARISLDPMKHIGAWALFLAILQQYDLPPTTRKAIETASKFFAKSRIQRPKKPAEWIPAYESLLKTLRAFSMAAHDALAHGKPRAAEGGAQTTEAIVPEKVKAGPFTLINTGGFNDAVLANCAKVVEHAAHQLQSHGLGQVCYGDVLISNTLMGPRVLAFYLLGKDEMFVRANLKGKEGAAVETVVHELAHRLQVRFIPPAKHAEIKRIYNIIGHKSAEARQEAIDRVWKDPHLKPKEGDIFVEKGKEFVVTGFDVSPKGGWLVKLTAKEQPPGNVGVLKAKISLEGYAAAKGILPKIEHSGFVSGYASTDPDENFAEMVAAYCAGKLPADQVEMLKAVLA